MAHDKPILELRDEAPNRPFLMLAGVKYHFSLQSDLSLEQTVQVQWIGKKFESLSSVDELTPELAAQIGDALSSSMQIVMHDMPADVAAQLTDGERTAILQSFVSALTADANPAAPSETTQPESPASTASTPSAI